MNIKRIWAKELRKRQRNDWRKQRANLNWPIHAQRAVKVFTAFKDAAEKDGVRLILDKPDFLKSPEESLRKSHGITPVGESSVELKFMMKPTGHGVINRQLLGGETQNWDIEVGASLIIHHSKASGVIEVFFLPPFIEGKTTKDRQGLLYTYTFDTDDLTEEWITKLIPKFLSFNRVESIFEKSSILDRVWVRWMRFMDIRNRRGYLKKLDHFFTPWELIFVGMILGLPLWTAIVAVAEWLGKLLNPFPL